MFREIIFLCMFIYVGCVQLQDSRNIKCSSTQYYDPSSYSCVPCDSTGTENKVVDDSVVDVYGNFVSCKCKAGFVRINNDCSDVSLI